MATQPLELMIHSIKLKGVADRKNVWNAERDWVNKDLQPYLVGQEGKLAVALACLEDLGITEITQVRFQAE